MKYLKSRFFLTESDCEIIVERVSTRKEIFSYLDEFIYNIDNNSNYFVSSDVFMILYEDGREEYINNEYDGHHIDKKGIVSMVYSNDCTYVVFGTFDINEYGVVITSFEENISNNIREIK